ncbi:polyprenyl-phospho-N-acetylgalactosaminyl synthase [Methylomarinovum caldicuralii]|uniref:Polyprenyl-phospho-N-acetylgalactosaminyl synthase n=1 Tax=Methylomarinovum caldicuralii TaxID=438856 RepID=A0AAU9BXS2_9GAMM|nr:glycosyltransferase family 2 protein [Methylomarinovum caldicuralii]BCX80822.1 polyprenyl-phospho-N-acetylgalactosaminyl synthase [Methylomarinovum caldicuralii]
MAFEPCAVIPVYNHSDRLGTIVAALRSHGLPCFLVDDGSDPAHRRVIDSLGDEGGVTVLRHARNRGKGAAVKTGLRAARAAGFSHALQIDADGQHELADVPAFLEVARSRPEAAVCGRPRFDASMPRSRYYGRWLTHVWVWINTASLAIPDAMCGFRVYPLAVLEPLLEKVRGDRMDFDIEILVRLHWAGVPMVWLPTRVRYRADGVSHFRAWEDNWRISRMHARLFLQRLGGWR